MPSGPIHLHIADVATAVPATVGVEAGLVMLTEDEAPFRSLRIIIGQPEAIAILAGWHGTVPGRPSTWDLFVSTVVLLGGRIDRVVITAVHEERHYFAHIEFEHGGERRILACRPSDAIALAVRAYNVDILAEPSVLDAAGVMPDGSKASTFEDPGKEPEVGESDSLLAEREAALAAREAELAERERALAQREHGSETAVTAEPGAADGEPVAGVSSEPVAADGEPVAGVRSEPAAAVSSEPVAAVTAEPAAAAPPTAGGSEPATPIPKPAGAPPDPTGAGPAAEPAGGRSA